MVRILVVGDLHGKFPKIHFKDIDCILAPGDFCSDEIKPLLFETVKQFNEGKPLVYWYEQLGKRKSKQAMNKSLKDGRKVLEYFDSFGIPVFVVPGFEGGKRTIEETINYTRDIKINPFFNENVAKLASKDFIFDLSFSPEQIKQYGSKKFKRTKTTL